VSEMRFDGRVAIVTGAGGNPGLGRSYAHLLASRGAKVVVNDLGVGPDGKNLVKAHADVVAREITELGGEAISDTNSVAEEDSAKQIVQTAIEAWGRVDILINNAGVAILAEFDEITSEDIERVLGVHVFGNVWMSRAVWPYMKQAGYGRILSAASSALLGLRYTSIYGMAKGAILALTRGLAVEGAAHGIRANAVGPAAGTAAMSHLSEKVFDDPPPPEMVAPAVAFLVHEDCPITGGWIESGGGLTTFRSYTETAGYANPEATIEDVRDNFGQIVDMSTAKPIPEPVDNPIAEIIVPKPYRG
jgi:NAD(P)-dependent dehydrogenase (short-subunit alcohol dehydrogenase family)